MLDFRGHDPLSMVGRGRGAIYLWRNAGKQKEGKGKDRGHNGDGSS